jgi:hypothetical protein
MRGLSPREAVMIAPPGWPLRPGEARRDASVPMYALAPGVLAVDRAGGAVNAKRARGAALVEPRASRRLPIARSFAPR